MSDEPWCATFLGRGPPRPGRFESTLLVRRDRYVGQGMREDLRSRTSPVSAPPFASARVDADFADLFEVKESRVPPVHARVYIATDGLQLERSYGGGTPRRGVLVSDAGLYRVQPVGILFDLVVPARASWHAFQALPILYDLVLAPRFPTDRPPGRDGGAAGAAAWRGHALPVDDDPSLARTLERTRRPRRAADLRPRATGPRGRRRRRALVHDPVRPGLPADVVHGAAGRPVARAGHAADTGRLQGVREDPPTEEQPGRILHEVRFGAEPALALGGRTSTTARWTRPRCS